MSRRQASDKSETTDRYVTSREAKKKENISIANRWDLSQTLRIVFYDRSVIRENHELQKSPNFKTAWGKKTLPIRRSKSFVDFKVFLPESDKIKWPH